MIWLFPCDIIENSHI